MARVNLKTAASTGAPLGGATEVPVTATHEERSLAVKKALASGQPIAIPFAKFSDGRGFSIARLLRSEHGYDGEILATGHTIPDQALHLLRSGFDTVEVADTSRLAQWQKSLSIYGGSYQTAARNPLALRREASLQQQKIDQGPSKAATTHRLKEAFQEPVREVA